MSWNKLKSNRIHFEPIDMSIVESLHEYASNESVSKFIGWPLMKSMEDSKNYVEKLMDNEKKLTHEYASIVLTETNKHIGCMMLFGFNREARHVEVGFVLHQDYWNKGYVSESLKLLMTHLKEVKAYHKICARVVSSNEGSSKVLMKNDFSLEGTLRDQFFIDGMYYDCLQYGILLD